MRWTKSALSFAATAAAGMMLGREVVAQCPMCKAAIASSEDGWALATRFNRGILFLVMFPFLMTGLIAWRFFGTQIRFWYESARSRPQLPGQGPEGTRPVPHNSQPDM